VRARYAREVEAGGQYSSQLTASCWECVYIAETGLQTCMIALDLPIQRRGQIP
jgi:hypothetical protein